MEGNEERLGTVNEAVVMNGRRGIKSDSGR